MENIYTVRTVNGHVWTFSTLEAAVLKVDGYFPIEKLKYGYLRTYLYTLDRWVGVGDDAVFYDECGLKIPVWKVKETFYNQPVAIRDWRVRRHLRRRPWCKYNPKNFRRGPVPGIGRHRWGGWQSHPRTRQEIRENEFLEFDDEMVEYGIRPRKKRTHYNLPTSWDDYIRSDYGIKNWKRHRAHQWKD